MTQEELNKILEEHEKWLRSFKRKGKRANLHRAALRYADLRGANLRGANLRGADLNNANLRGADLNNADLRHTDLSYADLRHTDLSYADLVGANLRCARLPERIIQVGPIGSRSDYTVFYVGSGIVKCGCWHGKNRDDYQGGTLEEFKQRIDEVYPASSDDESKLKHRKGYLAAIAMFEMMK